MTKNTLLPHFIAQLVLNNIIQQSRVLPQNCTQETYIQNKVNPILFS